HRRFRPFIEDCLPGLAGDRPIVMAHPTGETDLRGLPSGDFVLMVGPEGGFVPFEIELAKQAGAQLVTLGRRVLSVDTAVPAALGITAARALR
ncbi:MAG: 16S rRNA (uracil(1498)-N(3))-methyltransferase, partial [Cellvibrionales bacterium]